MCIIRCSKFNMRNMTHYDYEDRINKIRVAGGSSEAANTLEWSQRLQKRKTISPILYCMNLYIKLNIRS